MDETNRKFLLMLLQTRDRMFNPGIREGCGILARLPPWEQSRILSESCYMWENFKKSAKSLKLWARDEQKMIETLTWLRAVYLPYLHRTSTPWEWRSR